MDTKSGAEDYDLLFCEISDLQGLCHALYAVIDNAAEFLDQTKPTPLALNALVRTVQEKLERATQLHRDLQH